jgi:hypothetical protein
MSPIFQICFVLLLLLGWLFDRPQLGKSHAGSKAVYFAIFGAAVALWLSRASGLEVPMPTELFSEYVSPAMYRMIHPSAG